MDRTRSLLLAALLLTVRVPALAAEAPDPTALQAEISASHLEPARAVTLKNLKLNAGLATLHLDGLLVPASTVGGGTIELVFLGSGRIELDPPDTVEAGQLELFTGAARLDAEFKEAVLVVGVDAAVNAMLRRPTAQPDADTVRRAESLYTAWRGKRERKLLDVERGILLDALRDPVASGYFAAWFRAEDPGDFLYLVEPGDREQVTLGRFVPIDATEKEKRKISKEISRQQRKGRLLGLEVDDLGQWDTWLSASLRTADGKPSPGAPAFEPRKYTLEMTIDRDLRLAGKARIDLDPVVKGSRVAALNLSGDFKVSRVTDAAGSPLFFLRNEADLTVILPQAPAAGETPAVVVEYAGNPLEKDWNLVTLLDTLGWYPHAGEIDRATFDVTFHWPKSFDLVSSGIRAGGGEGPDGTLWERRILDLPSLGFSFEVGHFKIETAKAGHVNLRFAFSPTGALTGRGLKDEMIKTVSDSLSYYEEQFGPYPLDEMTVVTANRSFSQGMLGFVTVSETPMDNLWRWYFGISQDRRLVIAHEIAHQWWGNQVGWTSYRDQWISEAMASYAALRYAHDRLGDKLSGGDLNAGWQDDLTSPLPSGRPLESVGPVVLGSRLLSSRAGGAYQPIVYEKGSVVLNMLARGLGEENFPKVLKQIVKVSGRRGTVSTEEFISLIEQITSADLQPFARQFIYGTGLPETVYSYRFEKKGDGWVVKGEARQQTPHRFRYKVVQASPGRFDVVRETIPQLDVRQSTLVVPVDIAVYDPKQGKAKGSDGTNATIRGNVVLKGEVTPFEIPVENEPKRFWLDRNGRIFGLFYDQERHPKHVLVYQAINAAEAGRSEEALALFDKARTATEPPPENRDLQYATLQWLKRADEAQIELGRARLLLDQGKDDQADDSLGRAARIFGDSSEFKTLQARLEVRRGNHDKAFRQLRKGMADDELDSEGYALLAVAARASGHTEEYTKALKRAKASGADVAALTAEAP